MPKEIREISKFMSGTIISPSERDISMDAASDSLNIDPVAKDGVLSGINSDKTVQNKFSNNLGVNANNMEILNAEQYKEIIYFDPSDNKVKRVHTLSGSNINQDDVSTSAETVTGIPDMEPNNQEMHIGMGSGENDNPLWIGKVTQPQFGTEVTGIQRELDKLNKPGNIPPLDKVIKIGSYYYGAQDLDSKVYALNADGTLHNSSFDIFSSIASIAYHNDSTFWVLDKVSATVAELKLVDADSFEVTQTSTIDKINAKNDNVYDSGYNSDAALNTTEHSFASWFEDTSGQTTGGGASFITDIVETDGAIWYARGCGYQTDPDNMIRWRFLFRSAIPTFSGELNVYDVSFRTDHVLHSNSSTSQSDTEDGRFYKTATAGGNDDISVRLQMPFKCLTNAGGGCGLWFVPHNEDDSDSPVYIYSGGHSVTAGLTHPTLGSYINAFYFSDDLYYPAGSYNAAYTSNWIDTIGTDDSQSFKVRRYLIGTGSTLYDHVLSSVNYEGGSTTSVATYTETNQLRAFSHIADDAGDNFRFSYNSGGTSSSDWKGQSFQANLTLDTGEHDGYEIRKAFALGFDGGASSEQYLFRGGRGLSEKKFQVIKSSNSDGSTKTLDFAKESGISVVFEETGDDANWGVGTIKKIFYKFSFTYDGYQESPLGNAFIHILSSDTQARLKLQVKLGNLSSLSKRITHLNMYCAVSTNTTATSPDGFYRLVESIKLDSGWTDSTSDEDSNYLPAWGDIKQREVFHNGKVSTSYEARTGINEVIDDTLPNYAISTAHNSHLFIGNCHHKQIEKAYNYLFKSKPFNFSQVDWSTDFLILPTTPTAIKSFMGRVYAFDEDNMYRIEPNQFFIEDKLEGIGCIDHKHIAVSDYGMCFADKENIYLHDGRKAIPIGDRILKGSDDGWENKHSSNCIVFDTFRKAFIIFFKNANQDNRAWVYSVLKQRWDLWESDAVTAAVSRPNNVVSYITNDADASVLYSNGTNLITYLGDSSTKRSWNFTTKKLVMGENTNDKKFYKVKVLDAATGSINDASTGVQVKVDDTAVTSTGTLSSLKVPGSSGKGKNIQVFLKGQTGEVDAIGVIYRRLKPK